MRTVFLGIGKYLYEGRSHYVHVCLESSGVGIILREIVPVDYATRLHFELSATAADAT